MPGLTTVSAGSGPYAVAVNQVTNKVYVANFLSANVTVINSMDRISATAEAGTNPSALAVNPLTNKVYVTNSGSANVTAITEQNVNPIPLTTTISPLPDRRSASSTPTFSFTPTSSYLPTAPAPQQIYYQLDTWQNGWIAATPAGNGVDWSSTTTPLSKGLHILYAWAGDGAEGTSINNSSSPIVGHITAYVFVVSPSGTAVGTELAGGVYLPLVQR